MCRNVSLCEGAPTGYITLLVLDWSRSKMWPESITYPSRFPSYVNQSAELWCWGREDLHCSEELAHSRVHTRCTQVTGRDPAALGVHKMGRKFFIHLIPSSPLLEHKKEKNAAEAQTMITYRISHKHPSLVLGQFFMVFLLQTKRIMHTVLLLPRGLSSTILIKDSVLAWPSL